MPRRAAAQIRPVEADPVHRSKLVQQVINKVMLDGKKSTAERIVYDALALIGERSDKDPIETLEASIKALTPTLEVKSRRVGGATYQVPVEVASPCAGWSSSHASAARGRWPSDSPTSSPTRSPSRAAPTSARTTSTAWPRPTRPSRTTAGKPPDGRRKPASSGAPVRSTLRFPRPWLAWPSNGLRAELGLSRARGVARHWPSHDVNHVEHWTDGLVRTKGLVALEARTPRNLPSGASV